MQRSKSEGFFFADLCENFGRILNFGSIFRQEKDVVRDIYSNIHFIDTGELDDPQKLDRQDQDFNRLHRPRKYEEGRQGIYRELDNIQPQKRALLIRNPKAGTANFRAISLETPGALRKELRPNVEFDDLSKPRQFMQQWQDQDLSSRRKRMANIQMDLAVKETLRKRVRLVQQQIEEDQRLAEELRRQEEDRKAVATKETQKATKAGAHIRQESNDRADEYKRAILEFELEQELLKRKRLGEELLRQKKMRERARVEAMLNESNRVVNNLKRKLGLKYVGNINPGKPLRGFEDDLKIHSKQFKESSKRLQQKLDYYYGPYEKNRRIADMEPVLSTIDFLESSPMKNQLRGILNKQIGRQMKNATLPLKNSSRLTQLINNQLPPPKKSTGNPYKAALNGVKKKANVKFKGQQQQPSGKKTPKKMDLWVPKLPTGDPDETENLPRPFESPRVPPEGLFMSFNDGSRQGYNSDEQVRTKTSWAKLADLIVHDPNPRNLNLLCQKVKQYSSAEGLRTRQTTDIQGDEMRLGSRFNQSEEGESPVEVRTNSFKQSSLHRPTECSLQKAQNPFNRLVDLAKPVPTQEELGEPKVPSRPLPDIKKKVRSKFLRKNIEALKHAHKDASSVGGRSHKSSKSLKKDIKEATALKKSNTRRMDRPAELPPLKKAEWVKPKPQKMGAGLESQESALASKRTQNNTINTQRSVLQNQFKLLNLSQPKENPKRLVPEKGNFSQNFKDFCEGKRTDRLDRVEPEEGVLKPSLSTIMLFDFEKRSSGQEVRSPKLIDQKKISSSLNLKSNFQSGAISQRGPREGKLSMPVNSPSKKAPSGLRTDLGTYFRHKLALQKQMKSRLAHQTIIKADGARMIQVQHDKSLPQLVPRVQTQQNHRTYRGGENLSSGEQSPALNPPYVIRRETASKGNSLNNSPQPKTSTASHHHLDMCRSLQQMPHFALSSHLEKGLGEKSTVHEGLDMSFSNLQSARGRGSEA